MLKAPPFIVCYSNHSVHIVNVVRCVGTTAFLEFEALCRYFSLPIERL